MGPGTPCAGTYLRQQGAGITARPCGPLFTCSQHWEAWRGLLLFLWSAHTYYAYLAATPVIGVGWQLTICLHCLYFLHRAAGWPPVRLARNII